MRHYRRCRSSKDYCTSDNKGRCIAENMSVETWYMATIPPTTECHENTHQASESDAAKHLEHLPASPSISRDSPVAPYRRATRHACMQAGLMLSGGVHHVHSHPSSASAQVAARKHKVSKVADHATHATLQKRSSAPIFLARSRVDGGGLWNSSFVLNFSAAGRTKWPRGTTAWQWIPDTWWIDFVSLLAHNASEWSWRRTERFRIGYIYAHKRSCLVQFSSISPTAVSRGTDLCPDLRPDRKGPLFFVSSKERRESNHEVNLVANPHTHTPFF